MTKIFLDFIILIQSFLSAVAFPKTTAPRLGDSCIDDFHCQQRDSNSVCPLLKDQKYRLIHICTCKLNYHVEIVNDTEKCIYGDPPEEEKEGLTAAPIILCFMGCVIIEAFCLLAFRYWKKHRRADFSHHTINLEAFQLTDTRIPLPSRNRTVLSFMITSQEEESTSGAGSSSPPPYNQARITGVAAVQSEEPPPTYEEAMKNLQGTNPQSNTNVDIPNKCSVRKMSC